MNNDIKEIKGITNLLNDGEDIGIEYIDINGNQKYNIFEVDTLLSYICKIQKENEHKDKIIRELRVLKEKY